MTRLPLICAALAAALAGPAVAADPLVERGRYLVTIAGCNDCHTSGYMPREGDVPESEWLLGDRIGWRGPWGTTYAINLRLYMDPLSEAQWITIARNKPSRPPMPWFALRHMSDEDLRALYRYVRHLGPAGSSVPGFVPPDQEPATPYILMQPQDPVAAPTAGPATVEEERSPWDLELKPAKPRTVRPGH